MVKWKSFHHVHSTFPVTQICNSFRALVTLTSKGNLWKRSIWAEELSCVPGCSHMFWQMLSCLLFSPQLMWILGDCLKISFEIWGRVDPYKCKMQPVLFNLFYFKLNLIDRCTRLTIRLKKTQRSWIGLQAWAWEPELTDRRMDSTTKYIISVLCSH